MHTVEELFISLLETGSLTIELDKKKVANLKTSLHRIRKEYKNNAILFDDTLQKRLLEDNLSTHYNDETGYVTFEFTSKEFVTYKIIKT